MTKHFMNDIVSKEIENETEPSGSNGKIRAPDVHQNYAGISCRNDCGQCIDSSNIYQCKCRFSVSVITSTGCIKKTEQI